MVDSYFVAKDAGDYTFAVEVNLPPAVVYRDPNNLKKGKIPGKIACHYRFMVANQVLIELDANTKTKDVQKLACGVTEHGVGAIQLKPGYHPVQQWLDCTGERKLKADDAKQSSYPTICPNSGKIFNVDSFPGDEVQVVFRVRRPQESEHELVKANELVHEER